MKNARLILLILLFSGLFLSIFAWPAESEAGRPGGEMKIEGIEKLRADSISMTLCYGNYPYKEGISTEWGFSALIEGAGKTVLFDTGGSGETLLHNMKKMDIDLAGIDAIVLSHIHGDHVGGLRSLLAVNVGLEVYIPEYFPEEFKEEVAASGAKVMEVSGPARICDGLYTTGEIEGLIIEQALIISTDRGAGVVTGCAHPGIVKIVARAKELAQSDILFALGGFHLVRTNDGEIGEIISEFRDLGVRYAGPCHCSGDRAREMFQAEYGERYLSAGAGMKLLLRDLR